jgi:hypothetical protein
MHSTYFSHLVGFKAVFWSHSRARFADSTVIRLCDVHVCACDWPRLFSSFRLLGVLQLQSISVPRKALRVAGLMASLNAGETSPPLASSSSKRRSKPLVSGERHSMEGLASCSFLCGVLSLVNEEGYNFYSITLLQVPDSSRCKKLTEFCDSFL